MGQGSLSGHQSSRMLSDVWLTPPEILAPLGDFDLDPCAAPDPRPWPTATQHIAPPADGLSAAWAGRVWCNPPFGREAARWIHRMNAHRNGIALVAACTETAMFFETIWGCADVVLFVRGRPHFHRADGKRAAFNAGAPIALIGWGARNVVALSKSGLGHLVDARGCA